MADVPPEVEQEFAAWLDDYAEAWEDAAREELSGSEKEPRQFARGVEDEARDESGRWTTGGGGGGGVSGADRTHQAVDAIFARHKTGDKTGDALRDSIAAEVTSETSGLSDADIRELASRYGGTLAKASRKKLTGAIIERTVARVAAYRRAEEGAGERPKPRRPKPAPAADSPVTAGEALAHVERISADLPNLDIAAIRERFAPLAKLDKETLMEVGRQLGYRSLGGSRKAVAAQVLSILERKKAMQVQVGMIPSGPTASPTPAPTPPESPRHPAESPRHPAELQEHELTRELGQLMLKDSRTPAEDERIGALRAEGQKRLAPTPPAAPAPAPPSAASFADRFHAAFDAIDAQKGHNHVSLVELRKHFPDLSKEQFDAELRNLREQGHYGMENYEGRGGITPEESAAMVREGRDKFLHVSRKAVPARMPQTED